MFMLQQRIYCCMTRLKCLDSDMLIVRALHWSLSSVCRTQAPSSRSQAKDAQRSSLVSAVMPDADALAALATAYARRAQLPQALQCYAQIKQRFRSALRPACNGIGQLSSSREDVDRADLWSAAADMCPAVSNTSPAAPDK